MRPPKNLSEVAKEHWRYHSARLVEGGILTEASFHTWTMCCQVFGHKEAAEAKLATMTDPNELSKERVWYIGLCKQYERYSKQFGLLPADLKRSGLEKPQDIESVMKGLRNAIQAEAGEVAEDEQAEERGEES